MTDDNVYDLRPSDTEPPCETVGIEGYKLQHAQLPDPKPEATKEPSLSPAAKSLIKAAKIIDGNRAITHGDRATNFAEIARLWSLWLDIELTSADVGIMMTLVKVARIKNGKLNEDDFIDGAAYLAIAGELLGKEGA